MSEAPTVNQGYFDGHKIGRSQIWFLFIAAISYAFEFMDGQMFSYAVPIFKANWGYSDDKIALLSSLTFLGMFVGGILGGWAGDKWGRKKSFLTFVTLFSVGSLLTAFAQPSQVLVMELSRILTGVGLTGGTVVAMVYISEMLPAEKRGQYQGITAAIGTVSLPISALLIKWILSFGGDAWRAMFIFGGITILLVPICMKMLKESPRWLVQKGRIAEAEKVVEECIGLKTDLSIQAAANLQKSTNVGIVKSIQIMFSRRYVKRSIVALIICWGIIIGNAFLMNWSVALLTGLGLPLATVMTVFTLSLWGNPLGSLVAAPVADKGGRKIPIVIFCIITGLAFFGMGIVGASAVGFATFYFIRCIFGNGATSMMWSYVAESFPNSIRGSATGLLMGVGRIVIALSMFTLPVLIKTIGYFGVNAVNGLIFIVPAIIVLFVGDKTAKVSLEDLDVKA
jgi:Sugar phosphate permease